MSVITFIQHYQRSIEKSQDDEDRLLHCLQKLHCLQVRVSHLQATGVGRTVNALRKRQGPVSDAARKLVARWKQIVEAHVSSEDEAPEKVQAAGQQDKARSNFDNPVNQSLTSLTQSSSSGSESSSKQRQIEPTSSHEDLEPAYHRSPSPSPYKKSKPSRERSSEGEQHHSPTRKNKHKGESRSREKSSEGESSRNHSPAVTKTSKHGSREKSHSLDRSSEGGQSRHYSPAPGKKNKRSSREKSHSLERSSDREPSRRHSPSTSKKDKHSSSREKSHSMERKEKKGERRSREKSSSSRDNKSRSHSSREKSSKERNGSESNRDKQNRDKNSHEKNERHSESHKSKHKDEKGKNRHNEHHHSGSGKRESSSDNKHESNGSRREHKSSSNHHSSSSKSKKSDNHESNHNSSSLESKPKIKVEKIEDEKWKLQKIDLEERKQEELLKHIKSEPSTSFDDSFKYKNSNSESSRRKEEEYKPRIKKEFVSSDEDDGTSFGDALGALDLPVPKFKKEETKKRVKIDPEVRVKIEPPDSGDESPVPTTFEDALGSIDYSPSKPKAKKDKKKKSHGYADYVKPLPKSEELAAILDLPSNLNYRPLPQIPLRQQRTTASELDALAAVISNKSQRTKVFSGNKCFHGEIPSLQDMCIKILQENIDDIEYIGYAPFYLMEPVLNRASAGQLANIERHNPRLAEDTDDLWENLVKTEFRGSDRQDGECWRDVYERSLEEKADKLSSISARIKLNNAARKLPQRTTKLAFVNTQVKPPRSVMRQQAKHGTSRGSLPAPRPKPVPGEDHNQPGPSGQSSQASTLARTMGMLREGPSMSIKSKKRPAPLMQKTIKLMKTSYRR